MCCEFVLVSNSDIIRSRFRTRIPEDNNLAAPSYAVGCGDFSYVITSDNPYELQTFQLGMTPYMAKAPMNLINSPRANDPAMIRPIGERIQSEESCSREIPILKKK